MVIDRGLKWSLLPRERWLLFPPDIDDKLCSIIGFASVAQGFSQVGKVVEVDKSLVVSHSIWSRVHTNVVPAPSFHFQGTNFSGWRSPPALERESARS